MIVDSMLRMSVAAERGPAGPEGPEGPDGPVGDIAEWQVLAMGSTITVDLSTDHINFKLDAALNTPATLAITGIEDKEGVTFCLLVTIDATPRAITFPAGSITEGGFTGGAKTFAASGRHKIYCTIDDNGSPPVLDFAFAENIRAVS